MGNNFVKSVDDYSGAAEPPIRKNGSHLSRPREPPIYSSFVWSNSACCCRAGFHKPVRASRLPTSSLEAHTMLRTAVSGFIQP